MLLQHVHVIVRDGQEAAFEAALGETRQRVFMTPGFRGFTAAQGAEHDTTYLVSVRWEGRALSRRAAAGGPLRRTSRPRLPGPWGGHRPGLALRVAAAVTTSAAAPRRTRS